MQTILAPLDGSALAEAVLPFVRVLAPVLNARVVLLHVVTDPEHEYTVLQAPPGSPSDPASRWAHAQHQRWLQRQHEITAYLQAQAAPLLADGISVDYDVEPGLPAESIMHAAQRHNATLLTLASHGHGRLRRWVAGSVTALVAQQATIPVLLVREGLPTPGAQLRRILASLDGSAHSPHVLAHAMALAHRAHAELAVLQTLAHSIEDLLGTSANLAHRRASLAASVRNAYASHFGVANAEQAQITALVGLGNVLNTIVEEMAHHPADLVVIAKRAHPHYGRQSAHESFDILLHAVAAPLLLVPGTSRP